MNHSNAKREQLIREAVAERHALKNKSRRRLVMTIVLACLVVIGVVIYLVV